MQCDCGIEAVIGSDHLPFIIFYSLRCLQPSPLCGSMIAAFAGGQVDAVNGAAGQAGTGSGCYQISEAFKEKRA